MWNLNYVGLYIIISLILLVNILLILKLYIMKKSLNEIENLLNNILKSDTNNLITISSSDKYIKKLVIALNKELKELRNQKLQYKTGNQELKNNITNISHDLRTPLTAINGYIDLMQKEDLSNKQNKYLNIIKNKSNELVYLTEELFDFSKIMNSDIKIKMEKCCVNEILEETLLSYYNIFKGQNIVPQISICKEKIYKVINKISLVRIFENIISNALKYSDGDFYVSLEKDGKIIFSNKAPSLDNTTIQKIFDRYFTVENAKRSTGLGLSIAKKLIELNKGNIIAKYQKEHLIIEIKL